MKKFLLTVTAMAVASTLSAQLYVTEGQFSPNGVTNEGIVVGSTDQARPYYIWNPYTQEMDFIGGIAAGNGVGGVARFADDGKHVSAVMECDAIPVMTEWKKNVFPIFAGSRMSDICYMSANKIFTVGFAGDGNTAMAGFTTNNGVNWKNGNAGNPWYEGALVSIAAKSSMDALIGGHNGMIYYGRGNRQWDPVDIHPAGDETKVSTYWAMDFMISKEELDTYVNAQYGVVGFESEDGGYGVWQTSDGGDSFSVTSGVKGVPQHITHAGGKFFMVTKNGLIQRSDDNGLTWDNVMETSDGTPLHRIVFADDKKGMALADNVVYITRDAGENWESTDVLPTTGVNPFASVQWNDATWDGNRIIIVGNAGQAYQSYDDGKTFSRLKLEGDPVDYTLVLYANEAYNIWGTDGNVYHVSELASKSGWCAAVYDVDAREWNPLPGLGYDMQDVVSDAYQISGDGNYVVGLVHNMAGPNNNIQGHAAIWNGMYEVTDLGSRFADIDRSSRANAVSYDGCVVAGWQDVFGPWYASVWQRGEDGTYTQRMLLKDADKTENDIDFNNQQDMIANLLGYAQAVSADGKWIGGNGNSTWYAVHGAWLWNEEEGVIQLTENDGCVADISADGSKAIGWEGIGYSAWLWTKENGLRYIQDIVDEKGWNIPGFYIMSVYDMSPNGRYITGYGMMNDTFHGYVLDLEGVKVGIERVEAQVKAAVYPNPVATELHVDLPYDGSEVAVDITLCDMQGRTVRRLAQCAQSNVIDVAGLQAGTYVLDVRSGNRNKTFKIVIKH